MIINPENESEVEGGANEAIKMNDLCVCCVKNDVCKYEENGRDIESKYASEVPVPFSLELNCDYYKSK